RLIEQQWIGDAIARERIDHDPLLIGGGHLLRRGVEVEDALVEVIDGLHHRHLPVEPWFIDDGDRLAEFEHDRLLVLVHDEHGEVGDRSRSTQGHHHHGEKRSQHQLLPALFLPGSWSSGRKGTTPCPPRLSRMILSVPPSTRSMVSRYMRLRVTSGAFLYSS